MLIEFQVNNQKLTRNTKNVFLADKSNNILQCKFSIKGEDWENKQRFVLLRDNECNTYQLHLDNTNIITIPYDVLIKEKFSITLYGEDTEENRITTNLITFRLNESGYTTDIEDLRDVDPDIWTQIFDGIDSKSEKNHNHIVSDISDFPDLSQVALSGDYNDLKDKPSIPVKVSDLDNDLEYVVTGDSRLSDARTPIPHTHQKSDISNFPSSMPPLPHTHSKSDITNFPSRMPPTSHNHTVENIVDFPSIPSKLSDLTNDSNFIETSNINGLVRNDGTIDTTKYLINHQDISGKINYTDIIDNLTTNDGGKPLSAKQGKMLADMIGEIQAYVNR